jgi:hypothetical protein
LGDGRVPFEHVFGSSNGRHFSSIKTSGLSGYGIVESHVKSSADSGALGIDCTDAKDRGNCGIYGISSIRQDVTVNFNKSLNC